MRGLPEFLRGREKDKKLVAANQTWEIIGEIVGERKSIDFKVGKKIEKDKLPEELRGWRFYEYIGDRFDVSVSNNGPRQITIRSGNNSVQFIMRRPDDVKPVIEESRDTEDGRFPFTVELDQEPAIFTRDLTRFVQFHLQNQPRPSS